MNTHEDIQAVINNYSYLETLALDRAKSLRSYSDSYSTSIEIFEKSVFVNWVDMDGDDIETVSLSYDELLMTDSEWIVRVKERNQALKDAKQIEMDKLHESSQEIALAQYRRLHEEFGESAINLIRFDND